MENGKYKYEIHCHTDETSMCGKVPGAELVKIYKEKGYDGVVITDHYSQLTYTFPTCFYAGKLWEKSLLGYRAAKQAAEEMGDFTVLLGMEYRAVLSPIDYLVYGMTEEFIRDNGNMLFWYIRKFAKRAHKAGMIIVAPHPYRMDPFHPKSKYIDGAELINGKLTDEMNKKGREWAKRHKLKILTTGSDFHRTTHQNFHGILTDEPIKTNDDLIRILKSGEFEVITNDKM